MVFRVTRVMLDPSFDWSSNEIWCEAFAVMSQASNCQLVKFETEPEGPQGFSPFGTRFQEFDIFGLSREGMRGLNEVISHPDFLRFEKTCAVLFRRDNQYGEMREIDSEIFLYGLLSHFCELIETHQPNLLLFPVTPHFVETYALWFCAKVLGIRTLWFQPSSVAPMMLPRENLDDFVRVSDYVDQFSSESLAIADQSFARSISKLQNLDAPRYILRQEIAAREAQNLTGRLRALRAVLFWMITNRFSSRFLVTAESAVPRGARRFLQIFVPRSLSRRLRSKALQYASPVKDDKPFALFALHYEPERTSVPEGGIEMSQVQYLLKANNFLPEGVTLRVREHSSQLSPALQGYKGRSPHFYELVVGRFGMDLDVNSPMRELLESSLVVFTVTGNIALEAALRGTPVVYFGNPWWAGMPGTYAFSSMSRNDIAAGRIRAANSEAVKAFLRERVVNRMVPGGASESQSELFERFGEINDQFCADAGRDLGNFLIAYCDALETDSFRSRRS